MVPGYARWFRNAHVHFELARSCQSDSWVSGGLAGSGRIPDVGLMSGRRGLVGTGSVRQRRSAFGDVARRIAA